MRPQLQLAHRSAIRLLKRVNSLLDFVCMEAGRLQAQFERVRLGALTTVLLDIGLPGLDGYEVARRLRAIPELQGLQVIAVTGYGQDADKNRARAAGSAGHLVKPIDFAVLRDVLATAG